MKEVRLNLGGLDALSAYNRLQDEMERVRDGLKPAASPQKVRFTEYAASLFEHKLKTGRIKSAKSRQKWEYMIRLHLAPVFGEAIFGRIMTAAAALFEWERNPMVGIDRFDASEHPTYTEEEPNALTVGEVREFLAAMRETFPQHFAMAALGFATGLRPSSLRPLRSSGSVPT